MGSVWVQFGVKNDVEIDVKNGRRFRQAQRAPTPSQKVEGRWKEGGGKVEVRLSEGSCWLWAPLRKTKVLE